MQMTAPAAVHPTNQDPSQAPPNFDSLARFYRWMELAAFGPWLWWCRCHFLGKMGLCRRALILGDGDGRFTARLLQTNRTIRIDAVDASPAMLRSLVRRAGPHRDRVQTHLDDARRWQPAGPAADPGQNLPYDLVITHFFLDCLTEAEIRALAATLRAAISPTAKWVVSEFAVPEGWFGTLVARPVVWGLYCAFGWLTGLKVRQLPGYGMVLRQAGFSLEMRRSWLGGLLISEIWAATRADSAPGPHSTRLEFPFEILQSC